MDAKALDELRVELAGGITEGLLRRRLEHARSIAADPREHVTTRNLAAADAWDAERMLGLRVQADSTLPPGTAEVRLHGVPVVRLVNVGEPKEEA